MTIAVVAAKRLDILVAVCSYYRQILCKIRMLLRWLRNLSGAIAELFTHRLEPETTKILIVRFERKARMVTAESDFHRFKRFSYIGATRHVCLLFSVLYAFLQVGPSACLAFEPLDLPSFMQMQQEHYDAIKSGTIVMKYVEEYGDSPLERLAKEKERIQINFDLTKTSILKNPNYSSETRGKLIDELEQRYHREIDSLVAPQPQKQMYRKYIFDLSVNKYRLDEKPLGANSTEVHPRVIVTSEGTQIRYRTDIDQAVVDYFNNVVASDLPAYLGVVEPQKIRVFPENVTTFEEEIDGKKVLVYDLMAPDRVNKLRIYVDPAIGYRYCQVEWFSRDKIMRKIVARNYKLFDGIPFPTFHEDIIYSKSADNPVQRKTTIEIETAQFNQIIEPELFKIQFTRDTIITDMKLKWRFKPFADEDIIPFEVEDIVNKLLDTSVANKIAQKSRSENNTGRFDELAVVMPNEVTPKQNVDGSFDHNNVKVPAQEEKTEAKEGNVSWALILTGVIGAGAIGFLLLLKKRNIL